MMNLAETEINCSSCKAPCCTFKKNSMRITPLEAKELYNYLSENEKLNEELINRLQECIKEFRLDVTLLMGKRNSFRRTYTCPFFKNQSLGCSIPNQFKPYGCLAFNPTQVGVLDGEGCESNVNLLNMREVIDSDEEDLNFQVKQQMKLSWDKESIPVAILDFYNFYRS